VKKDIRKMSYNKRVTEKIRSADGPLRMGRRELAEKWVKWMRLERFLGFGIFLGFVREGELT
jgi:hypothetical protein